MHWNPWILFSDLNGWDEFPVQFLAHLFPDFVLFNALLSVLQHGKVGQKFALVQQLAELVHRVVIIEEVDAVLRAEFGVRPLNFHEEVAQRFLQFGRHDGRFDAQLLLDERDVLVVLVVPQLLQNLFGLFVGELRVQINSLLFDLVLYVFQHVGRDLRGLLGLELRQNLLEVVDALVSVKTRLLGRFFVRRFLVLHQVAHVDGAVVAHHDAFIFHRDHFAGVAVTAHVGLKHILADINVRRIQIGQIPLHVVFIHALQLVFFGWLAIHAKKIIQDFGLVVPVAYLLLVFKVIKYDFVIVQVVVFALLLVLADDRPQFINPFLQFNRIDWIICKQLLFQNPLFFYQSGNGFGLQFRNFGLMLSVLAVQRDDALFVQHDFLIRFVLEGIIGWGHVDANKIKKGEDQ